MWTDPSLVMKAGLSPAVVVVGDHGMADGGGHGGSSKPEILVPFVFLQETIALAFNW